MRANRIFFASLGLLVSACAVKGSGGDENEGLDDGSDSSNADEGGTEPADEGGTFGDEGPATTGADSGGPEGSTGAADEAGDSSEGGFIAEPDGGGGTAIECDVWAQDCPEGEKCSAWSNDGDSSWNATKCVPVSDSPDQPGDSCTVEGNGVSGLDSCDLGSLCWGVNPDTNVGTCLELCTGTPDAPVCPSGSQCSITNDGVLTLCLPECDPLLQDCGGELACYWVRDVLFLCAPDSSGETGAHGDPCEYINACDEGNQCIGAESVAGCEGSLGCCSQHCDVSDPEASAACPGAAMGEECVALFDPKNAPPGLENVGLCALP